MGRDAKTVVKKKERAISPSIFSLHIQWNSTRTRVYLTLANVEKNTPTLMYDLEKGDEFAPSVRRLQKRG